MPQLTPRQREALGHIVSYIDEHGQSPTMVELADTMKIGKVTAYEHVCAIEEKGYLTRTRHRARSIELSDHVVITSGLRKSLEEAIAELRKEIDPEGKSKAMEAHSDPCYDQGRTGAYRKGIGRAIEVIEAAMSG